MSFKNTDVNLRELVDELNTDVSEDLPDFNEFELSYSTNGYVEIINIPDIRIVDSDNNSLYDDEDGTGLEKTLKEIYDVTSKLEETVREYNNVLKRRLEVFGYVQKPEDSSNPKGLVKLTDEDDWDEQVMKGNDLLSEPVQKDVVVIPNTILMMKGSKELLSEELPKDHLLKDLGENDLGKNEFDNRRFDI